MSLHRQGWPPVVVATIVFAFWAAIGLLAFGLATPAQADDPLDQQVTAISSGLNCPVCGDKSAAESSEPMAVQMRDLIRKKLSEGESRDEIVGYFVDRYGEGIKRDPLRRFLQNSIWWVVGGLVIGGGSLLFFLSNRSRPSLGPGSGVPNPPESARLADPDELVAEMALEPRGKPQVYRPKRKREE